MNVDVRYRTFTFGDLTWPIVRDKVDAVVTVSESEIVAAGSYTRPLLSLT